MADKNVAVDVLAMENLRSLRHHCLLALGMNTSAKNQLMIAVTLKHNKMVPYYFFLNDTCNYMLHFSAVTFLTLISFIGTNRPLAKSKRSWRRIAA